MPKFYNKDSSLTLYSLACGYIERTEKDGISIELWQEGACFHVRKHERNKGERVFWESFECYIPGSITKARKLFRANGGKYSKVAHCQHELAQAGTLNQTRPPSGSPYR